MTEKFSLKDHLFNEARVRYLGQLLARADEDFDEERFVITVMSRLPDLLLKERIKWIADVVWQQLGSDFPTVVAVLLRALPPPLDPTKTDNDFGDFIFAPFGEIVAVHGCTHGQLTLSFDALEALTQRFSMEDAVRYFLRAFPQETLMTCRRWASHESYHVRRLVSEGTRPLLPWSGRVPLGFDDTLPLLTMLYADKTRYVARSVANHLNDIAKQAPELVLKTLKEWRSNGKQATSELDWMTRHALRTLVKQGNQEALALLGYDEPVLVTVENFLVRCNESKIAFNPTLQVELTLQAPVNKKVLVDYRIHFVKKNGSTTPKVFKWKTVALQAGESLTLTKRHRLRFDATTYSLYPGRHLIDVQINGVIMATASVTLV